jgi:hypothetical protein
VREHYACIEEAGGAWIDLLGPYYEKQEAEALAREVAKTWGCIGPIAVQWAVRRNRRELWIVLGWGAAVMLGLVWAGVVEMYGVM